MNISPAWTGALRSLGILVLMSVLSWLSVQANVAPLFGTTASGIIVLIVAAIENSIKENGGGSLFGAIK